VSVTALKPVPSEIVDKLGLIPCERVANATCSLWDDLKAIRHEPEKGAQIWVDDAAFVHIVSIPIILLESKRYRLPFALGYLLLSLTLGFDVVLPFFFMHLLSAERQHVGKDIGRYHWLYLILAIIAVGSWLPNLLDWVLNVGTVAGQLEAGCKTAIGSRATWAIMGMSFTFGFYSIGWCHAKFSKNNLVNGLVSWLFRILLMMAIASNVAAAMASYFFFREFVTPPSFVPNDAKIKK